MINLRFITPRCTTSSIHKKGKNNKKQRKHRKRRRTHHKSFNSSRESFDLDARHSPSVPSALRPQTRCIFRLNVGSLHQVSETHLNSTKYPFRVRHSRVLLDLSVSSLKRHKPVHFRRTQMHIFVRVLMQLPVS